MKKDELILMLEEGVSIEEIPTLSNLDKIERLIEKVDLNSETLKKIKVGIQHLKEETIRHAKSFSEMVKYAVKNES